MIGLAIDVHRTLGPGLLRIRLEAALSHELAAAGICFRNQLDMPLEYKGIKLGCGYRLDFLIEEELIVELKAVEDVGPCTSPRF